MKNTKLKKTLLAAFVFFVSVTMNYGQLFKPVVTDVGSGLKKQEFVLVVKANEKFEKPERVVMSDWKASDEAFDPEKMDSYPKWSFQNFMVIQKDGSQVRHIILKNETTGKYFSYSSGVKMRTEKEYDAYFAKNDQNKYIKSLKEQNQFLFMPQIDGNYIRLGIPNDTGRNLAVTPMDWNTRYFKLVLVK